MKQLNYFARLALDWLMVAVGVLGSLFCLITAFDLPATDSILSAVIFVTVLDCLLLSGRRLSRISAPILLAVLVLFGFLLRKELFESFRNLWGQLISRYALGYDQLRDLMLREPTSPAATGQALSFLGLVMALPVSCAVRWWKRSFPAALALLPGIVPCFILTDTPPALLPLLAAAASILVQIFSQSVRRREAGEEGKAIGLAALITGVLLGLLLLLFPRDSFEPFPGPSSPRGCPSGARSRATGAIRSPAWRETRIRWIWGPSGRCPSTRSPICGSRESGTTISICGAPATRSLTAGSGPAARRRAGL